MELENIKSLLSHVSLLVAKNNELLDATGARFNMFRICGVNHYENTHSAIITEFLNPNDSHGMGSLFLETFFKVSLNLDDDFKITAENCRVNTKIFTGDGRMDILIADKDEKYAICIENKIYAEDQHKQLQRYAEYLEKNYKKHWKIYYLSFDDHSASTNSAEGVGYAQRAYSPSIINWLEECIKIAAEKPMPRETLCQ